MPGFRSRDLPGAAGRSETDPESDDVGAPACPNPSAARSRPSDNITKLCDRGPDGKISLPLINDIPAAGYTPEQLGADITARLTKFVTDPVVDVSVLAVNSKRVFLVGEVEHAGPMAITPGMTILQAIASAGLTPYANKTHIYILRGDPVHQQKVMFDYKKALKKGDMQGVSLVPGDTIVVP